jgi:MFS family permease
MATGRDDSATLPPLRASRAEGWRLVRGGRVLVSSLLLSLAGAATIAAAVAVALPYAAQHSRSSWGGALMAAPILGAVAGLLLIGRLRAPRQHALVVRLALLSPLPLLVTIFEPRLTVVWTAWFTCGALLGYQRPLWAAVTELVPSPTRGRVLGLAGALTVGVMAGCILVARWISEHISPAASVGICAVVTSGALVLLASRWPQEWGNRAGLPEG